LIIGTAGHVEHGKTTLMRALTGVDPDRLPEEKRRGMTIDLGYAYAGPLGFIDVPGHERLVATMLAGVGGIDAALLVVAADEGVMPQTLEHTQILDLLGLDRGGAGDADRRGAGRTGRLCPRAEPVARAAARGDAGAAGGASPDPARRAEACSRPLRAALTERPPPPLLAALLTAALRRGRDAAGWAVAAPALSPHRVSTGG
jgi:hypothetical protein